MKKRLKETLKKLIAETAENAEPQETEVKSKASTSKTSETPKRAQRKTKKLTERYIDWDLARPSELEWHIRVNDFKKRNVMKW